MIGSITTQVTLNETTTDTLTVTNQPVQQGASIADHAYQEPTVFGCTIYQQQVSNAIGIVTQTLSQIYQQFQNLQSSLTPFSIVTPKRIYNNMLMISLGMTTDKATENILALHLSFKQVILVSVSTTLVVRSNLKNPGSNSPTQNAGTKQSAFFTAFGGQ
jgi:hypothetical protein